MNLQQLIYFKKVAELEHYTKASKELHISQPCLSYAISELEKELEVPLFVKRGRNIKLSKYGALFLKHVEKALDELEEGKKELAEKTNPKHGEISLAYISSMNGNYIPTLLHNFYDNLNHADIKINMSEMPTMSLVEGLISKGYDVGFGSYIENNLLEFFPVYNEATSLIVGKDHPLASKSEVTLEEASHYNFIEYNNQCGIRWDTDKLFAKSGINRKIIRECEDNLMVVGMVANGEGIAIVPQAFSNEYYNVKSLHIIGEELSHKLYMIWLKDTFISPVVKEFINFVKVTTKSTDCS